MRIFPFVDVFMMSWCEWCIYAKIHVLLHHYWISETICWVIFGPTTNQTIFFFSIPYTRIPFFLFTSYQDCFSFFFFDIDILMDRPCEMASHCGCGICVSLVVNAISEPWTSRCSSGFYKRQRNQRSNCQHPLDHRKSKRVPEKHLFLLYWLCQRLWLCGSQ